MPLIYHPFGPFQALTQSPGQYVLHTRRGPIELTPTAPGVLRVRTSHRRRLPAYTSHAVLAQPAAPPSQLEPSAEGARLSFDRLTLSLTFDPLRLQLLWG